MGLDAAGARQPAAFEPFSTLWPFPAGMVKGYSSGAVYRYLS